MELIEAREYNNVQVEMDRGSILNGSTYIIPVGRSPLPIRDSASVISGWPLYYIYPNMRYGSRYHIDVPMLLEDLALDEAYISNLPTSTMGSRHAFYSLNYDFRIANLVASWNLLIPEGTIRLDELTITGRFGDNNIPTIDYYHSLDLGTNLTNPNDAGISNHYIIKYGALDRGYGRAKHGWFYADVAGTWSWTVDANDVAEISIDDGVVASKYTDSGTVGIGILSGTIDLSVGWHQMFAYTSDRGSSAYPTVGFKRPGDLSWQYLATDKSDGIVWCNARIVPDSLRFRYNAGNITAILRYDESNELDLTFDATLLHSGNVRANLASLPRYKPYYWWSWRESTRPDYPFPQSMPPIFNNMRCIMQYVPSVETLFYTEFSIIDYTPRFVLRPRSGGDVPTWYRWDGTSFQTTSVASVADLDNNGNTLYELNQISLAEWDNFTGTSDRVVEIMFTREPPLALASNRRLLGDPNEAQFMLSNKNRMQGNIMIEKRDI